MKFREFLEGEHEEEEEKEDFKSNPKYTLPENHKPAMKVPKGGSMCANCKWVSEDKKNCNNSHYFKFYGTKKLPGPADELCSDWWEGK